MAQQEQLQKLKLKCYQLARQKIEANEACKELSRRVQPGIFSTELIMPDEITGIDMVSETQRCMRELAKVHPTLEAQLDTLLSDAVLDQCAKDYDELLEKTNKELQAADDQARHLHDQFEWNFQKYERAGGAVYDVRIDPQVLDEEQVSTDIAFNGKFIEPEDRLLSVLKKAVANLDLSVLRDRLQNSGLKNWTLIEANDDHPAQIACAASVASDVRKEIGEFMGEGVRTELHMIQDRADQIPHPDKEGLIDIIKGKSSFYNRLPLQTWDFTTYRGDKYRALSESYERQWNPRGKLSADVQPLLQDLDGRISTLRQQILASGRSLSL